MSRTDKDAPWQVRADYFKPNHDWKCPNHVPRYRAGGFCTLPAEPVRANMSRVRLRPGEVHCRWVPDVWDRKYYTRPPRRDDRRVFFHGPARRMVRDFCAKAKQEYFGSGEVQSVEPGPKFPNQLAWWD